MSDRPQTTIRRGDRVRYRYARDNRIGRVVDTTHCAAIVWWAPTLEHLRAQEHLPALSYRDAQDSIYAGCYSFRDLEQIQ